MSNPIFRHSRPSGNLLIPRAEEKIAKTIARFRTVRFQQDPLMSMAESFVFSIWGSAVKREGGVLEAAIKDAVEQTPTLRLLEVRRTAQRHVDVLFETLDGCAVALEIKRGVLHDSTKIRQFRADLIEMPKLLQCRFHIVFLSGVPPIVEGFTPADLKKTYGLDIAQHADMARLRFSCAVRAVIEERT